jgi:hypothetical protein
MATTQTFDEVVVELEKLHDYCLSDTHPRGRSKARVFRSRLGLTATDAEFLRQSLIQAVREEPGAVRPTKLDAFGQRFNLDFPLTTARGTAVIRSAWIERPDQPKVLRLLTCFVL